MNTEHNLEFKIFETYELLCEKVVSEILENLNQNPAQLLCIAAGHTSLGMLEQLVLAYQEGLADFSRAAFVAMDEWLDMTPDTVGSCGYFLKNNFLNYVNYQPENIRLWDASVAKLTQECSSVEEFIEAHSLNGGIDYLVLGSGMNGHLALNEPGVDFSLGAHICRLDPVTQKVGQKYFSGAAALTGGATLGIKNFREARRCVLTINGEHKRSILKAIRESEGITNQLPATAVKGFDNASLYCDITSIDRTTRL